MQSTPATTTQINKTELPKWVNNAAQANYKEAGRIAGLPDSFYQGDRVAGLDGNFGKAQGLFDNIGGINTDFSKINPNAVSAGGPVSAGSIADTDLSKYLNPYLNEVEGNALNTLDRSRLMSLNSNSDAATAASAFGGSRHGIVDALTNSETAREAGILSAGIRADGFNTATGLANTDINRQLSTDMYNRDTQIGVDTGNASRDLSAQTSNQGMEMESASQKFRNLLQQAQGTQQLGGIKQAHAQSMIDSDRQKFDEPRQRQIEDLNLMMTSLGMSPYGQTSNSQTTQQGGSSGTDFGSLGLGIASLLFGLSDDDSKEDKQKIGETDEGYGIWAFRYKGDPKSYPKSIGLMASEIEKKNPEFVKTLDSGTRIVNYGGLEQAGLLAGVA